MKNCKIIAIGDNVCDKYISRGKMYPGGQCVNTCVYAKKNDTEAAYLGKYGSDKIAKCVQDTLKIVGIDDSHSRYFEGENGFALVTLKDADRVFLGSNKGGVAKEYAFNFVEEDYEYIKKFNLIYTNLNSYIEADLEKLYETGVPIAYDFSNRWTAKYLSQIGSYVEVAIMSCAHLSDAEREVEMKRAQESGIKIVLGTIGEKGSYVLYKERFLYAPAVSASNIIDTMGAGDAYFAAFLCSMLHTSETGALIEGTKEKMISRLKIAMDKGASFAASICSLEGAFGYGVPIEGRTKI